VGTIKISCQMAADFCYFDYRYPILIAWSAVAEPDSQ
jgi:hypothetical protein